MSYVLYVFKFVPSENHQPKRIGKTIITVAVHMFIQELAAGVPPITNRTVFQIGIRNKKWEYGMAWSVSN